MALLSLPLLLTSCDVHERPDIAQSDVYVSLLFDLHALPTYQEVYYDLTRNRQSSRVSASDMELRYLVRCYAANSDSTYDEAPCREFRFTNTNLSQLDYRCRLSLMPGRYRVRVWTDYVLTDAGTDYYYDTSNFADISFCGDKNSYTGSTDFRTAFVGEKDIVVPPTLDIDKPISIAAEIDMVRPLARYKFVTTDLSDFIEKYLGITDPAEAARVDLSGYQILFRYTGFLPTHFNLYTDRPFDAEQGYQFLSSISEANGSEATLGFDYVFVNGHASSVSVAIGIYSKEGTLLSFSNPVEVPLMRNQQTIVRGRFLTTNSSGSIAIDHEYDGNYDIIIQ